MTRGIPQTLNNSFIPVFMEVIEWLYGVVVLRCRQGSDIWDVRITVPASSGYNDYNDWDDD
jgi:hypothetical protein